jgi:hypothetical protein
MRHALMYQGSFEDNYPSLRPGKTTYHSTDGLERELPAWPTGADGVRIGYMERHGKKFVAVRLQFEEHDIVLQDPLIIDPMLHMGGKRFAPEPTVLEDELASTLLDDVIRQNPEQATDIALLINRVNQVRRSAS